MNFKAILFTLAIAITFTNCKKDNPVDGPTLNQVRMCSQISSGSNLCDRDNPVFSPTDQKFFVTAILRGASENDQVTFSWYGIASDGQYVFIDDITIKAGDFGSGSKFDLKASLARGANPWPVGDYEVDITLDNGVSITKGFSVI